MKTFAFTPSELPHLAQLLLDVASSDLECAPSELAMIRDLLCDLGGVEQLPDPVLDAIALYDPATFDLDTFCAAVPVSDASRRRQLMALVGSVAAADGKLVPEEIAYISRIAERLGVADRDLDHFYDDLVAAMSDLGYSDAARAVAAGEPIVPPSAAAGDSGKGD